MLYLVVVLLALILCSYCAITTSNRRKLYAPGPIGWPLIGNIFDIPKSLSFKRFARWSKEYDSDIIYLNAAGTPIVVLNSIQSAIDLLEKRSSIYSDRPHLMMLCELMQGARFLAMMPYGNSWRKGRKLMQKHLSPSHERFSGETELEFVHKLLLPGILKTPQDFLQHIRTMVGGSMVSMAYGLPVRRSDDSWIQLAENALAVILSAAVPGKYIVDSIPAIKCLPEWFPGTRFQSEARKGRQIIHEFLNTPFNASRTALSKGIAKPSFVSECLNSLGEDDKTSEDLIKDLAGMIFAGGTDSSVTGIVNFVLAMVLHPDVQAKAQKELDLVVGRNRLPDFGDRDNLPYLSAVVKEVLRWRPTVPAGNPHMSTRDDMYRGYFIPKGSIVIANTWSMMRDESNFVDPDLFDPERFLKDGKLSFDAPDPETVATFGFGRRACPGAHIARSSFWIAAASLLACFDIRKPLDAIGNEVRPREEYLSNTVVYCPEPFECRFIPRFDGVETLIRLKNESSSEYV